MTLESYHVEAAPVGCTARGIARLVRVLARWWADGRARQAQRRALGTLDERALDDIGINRADAGAEGAKPFWRR